MKRILLSLFIASSMSMAAVHAGLKDAIDKNDMKKASAIIEKMGVRDIYCPATLSASDGHKLFGARFVANPDLLYSHCAPEFIETYSGSACSNVETMGFCRHVLDKTPVERWLPHLKSIMQYGLDKVPEEYNDKAEVESRGPKKGRVQCLSELEGSVSYLDAFSRGDEAAANKILKDCMNGKIITVKTVKKTRYVNPFESYFVAFGKAVIKGSSKLLGFDEDGMENIKFVRSLEKFANKEQDLVKECIKSYKEKSYVSDKLIVKSCRFSYNIDKLVETEAGFQVFTCKDAALKYGSKNAPVCALTADGELYTTEPIQAGAPSYTYSCTKGIWTEASAKQVAAAKKQAEREAKKLAEQEAKKQAEEEAKLKAAEKAEREAKKQAEREAKKQAEQEAKKQAEEEARVAKEAEAAAKAEKLANTTQKIKFKSNPDGAFVSVDGQLLENVTPCTVELSMGNHDVVVFKDQYLVKDTVITLKTLKEGKVIVYTINLEPSGI